MSDVLSGNECTQTETPGGLQRNQVSNGSSILNQPTRFLRNVIVGYFPYMNWKNTHIIRNTLGKLGEGQSPLTFVDFSCTNIQIQIVILLIYLNISYQIAYFNVSREY